MKMAMQEILKSENPFLEIAKVAPDQATEFMKYAKEVIGKQISEEAQPPTATSSHAVQPPPEKEQVNIPEIDPLRVSKSLQLALDGLRAVTKANLERNGMQSEKVNKMVDEATTVETMVPMAIMASEFGTYGNAHVRATEAQYQSRVSTAVDHENELKRQEAIQMASQFARSSGMPLAKPTLPSAPYAFAPPSIPSASHFAVSASAPADPEPSQITELNHETAKKLAMSYSRTSRS